MTTHARELDTQPVLPARALEMAGRHLGVPSAELALTRLAGDASSRAYFRARPSSGRADSANHNSHDPSVIIALYPAAFDATEPAAARLARSEAADPALRLTFANDPCAHLEITLLFLEAGLPVPRVIDVEGNDRVMLIEEVGDCKLQDWLGECSPEEKARAYRSAIELIVRIQELTQAVRQSESICSKLAFDEPKLKWELDFFFKNYFDRHLALELSQNSRQAIDAEFTELCRELSALPRVLVHRDYHARNLMMRGRNIFIIDHQDARMGPESYDLVSLIADPYAGIEQALASELVEYFVEMKSTSRLQLSSVDQFRDGLELATIQRVLKAAGTYSSQAALHGNLVYLPFIPPAVNSALVALHRINRFPALRALLTDTEILA
jgi:aminoglycoside/choline kinase family phosphotransferase